MRRFGAASSRSEHTQGRMGTPLQRGLVSRFPLLSPTGAGAGSPAGKASRIYEAMAEVALTFASLPKARVVMVAGRQKRRVMGTALRVGHLMFD
jgi:hypothetical protein